MKLARDKSLAVTLIGPMMTLKLGVTGFAPQASIDALLAAADPQPPQAMLVGTDSRAIRQQVVRVALGEFYAMLADTEGGMRAGHTYCDSWEIVAPQPPDWPEVAREGVEVPASS